MGRSARDPSPGVRDGQARNSDRTLRAGATSYTGRTSCPLALAVGSARALIAVRAHPVSIGIISAAPSVVGTCCSGANCRSGYSGSAVAVATDRRRSPGRRRRDSHSVRRAQQPHRLNSLERQRLPAIAAREHRAAAVITTGSRASTTTTGGGFVRMQASDKQRGYGRSCNTTRSPSSVSCLSHRGAKMGWEGTKRTLPSLGIR